MRLLVSCSMLVEMGKMPDLRRVLGGADDRQSGRVGMVTKYSVAQVASCVKIKCYHEGMAAS